MAIESEKDLGDTAGTAPVTSTDNEAKMKKKKKKGLLLRMWNSVFGSHKDDFEKRLQHISKEEAAVIARTVKRSHSWRRMRRHLIILSIFFEVIAVACAIMTTRSLKLNWKMRALRVLPMFLLPGISFFTYTALGSFTRMTGACTRKIDGNVYQAAYFLIYQETVGWFHLLKKNTGIRKLWKGFKLKGKPRLMNSKRRQITI